MLDLLVLVFSAYINALHVQVPFVLEMTHWQGLYNKNVFFSCCVKYTEHYQQIQDVCKSEFCEKLCLCRYVCWVRVLLYYCYKIQMRGHGWLNPVVNMCCVDNSVKFLPWFQALK